MFGFKHIDIHSIGIALTATGIPIGMYLNQFLPIVKWAPVIFSMSIILIINWKNVFKFKFPSKNKIFNWIILFQIVMLIYGLNSGTMTTQNLSFHLYICALCFALMTLSANNINDKLPVYIYLMSLPCIILGVLVCQLHWVSGEEAWRLREYSENFVIEPFAVANGAITNIFAACCVFRKNIIFKMFCLISIIAGFYILFESDKRTPVVVALIGILYFMYCKRMMSVNIVSKNMIYIFILIIIFIIGYLTIPYLTYKVDTMFENIISGIANILGDTSVSDSRGSGIMRYERRLKVYDYINTHFTPINYVMGGGYFIMWVDNPLLEAYLDMGILGGFLYFLIILYYPFKIIKRKINNDSIILFGCTALYAMLSVFNSGTPYMAIKYIPVCFLAFCFKQITHKYT